MRTREGRWLTRIAGVVAVPLLVAGLGVVVGLRGPGASATWRAAPPNATNTYDFSDGFSDVQGKDGWYYEQWDGHRYSDMSWDPANQWWRGDCEYCIISRTWIHPDANDSALAWRAPRSGRVTLSGFMSLADSSPGDGVRTVIEKRVGTTVTRIWPSTPYQQIRPNFVAQHLLMTDVDAGDVIYFRVNQGGNSSHDTLAWAPQIRYAYEPEYTLDSAQLVMAPDDYQRVGVTLAQDSSLSVVPDGSGFDFYHSSGQAERVQKFRGTLDKPAGTSVYDRDPFTDPHHVGGQWWIENVYRTDDGHLLAFCHIEDGDVATTGWWAIGLAYSTDDGQTFEKLGVIVSQTVKDDGPNRNIYGVPYVIKDGYFYIYYGEPQASVARAPVDEVLAAADRGAVSQWRKYFDGKWDEAGLGGRASAVIAGPQASLLAIHGDAAYSTYLGQYVLSGYSAHDERAVFLAFSRDAVCFQQPSWLQANADKDVLTPYETILGVDGSDNGVVGQSFYVYYAYRFNASTSKPADVQAGWRWLYRQRVTLNRAGFAKQTTATCDP